MSTILAALVFSPGVWRSKCFKFGTNHIYHLVTRRLNGGQTQPLYNHIYHLCGTSTSKGWILMFCKDGRWGWWDLFGRRLKVGGYKMVDVLRDLNFRQI